MPFCNPTLVMRSAIGITLLLAGPGAWAQSPLPLNPNQLPIRPQDLIPKGTPRPKAEAPPSKDRITAVIKRLEALEAEKANVLKEFTQLPQDIVRLQQMVQWLGNWQQADFVLGNSTSPVALAIRHSNNGFRVQSIARNADVRTAAAAARQAGVLRIGSPVARELARQISTRVQEYDEIPSEFATRIQKDVWKAHRFVPLDPDVENPSFVVYRDVQQNKQRVGFLVGNAGPDQFVIRSVSTTNRDVPRGVVQTGSVRAERGKDIVGFLEEGDSFLDYCILNVGQKVGTPEDIPNFVCVAVHVALEVPELDEDARRNAVHDVGLIASEAGLSSFGAAFGLQMVNLNGRTNSDVLTKAQRAAEDKLYQKLIELGIPVVEREHLNTVEQERKSLRRRSSRDFGNQLDATHVLVADIDESVFGRVTLSMRLVDVSTGQAIWAGSGEDTLPREEDWGGIMLHGGRPVIADASTLENGIKSQLIESPRLLMVGKDDTSTQIPDKVLVVQEAGLAGVTNALYRPLFGRNSQPVSFDQPLTPVNTIDVVPRDQQYRYLMWQLGQKMLTPAGRITELKPIGDHQQATVTLGKQHGVRQGDLLRVLRSNESSTGPAERLIPCGIRATVVYDNHCEAMVTPSGLGSYWDDATYAPQVSDVVVSRFDRRRKVAVFPAAFREPQTVVERRASKWDEKNKFGQFSYREEARKKMEAIRLRIRDEVRQGVEKLDVEVVQGELDRSVEQQCAEAWERGCRIAIGGFVSSVSTTRFRFELQLVELQQTESGYRIGNVLVSDQLEVTEKLGLQQAANPPLLFPNLMTAATPGLPGLSARLSSVVE
ncbi:hypothetical protein GC163_23580 [bacterium]|nr:hypothetical protein [bacterium]